MCTVSEIGKVAEKTHLILKKNDLHGDYDIEQFVRAANRPVIITQENKQLKQK